MAIQNNLPTYAGLFGNIDFKTGDQYRSVYSPAAYLADLLQVLDDEFDPDTIDFDGRRADVKMVDLDAENTITLIPYLDIVNEILEGRIAASTDAAYETLKTASYPFNLPFSLDNERLKNHLGHLGISTHELRRLFATDSDYLTVAREYLGLSVEELDAYVEQDEISEDGLSAAFGYTSDDWSGDASDFTGDLSLLSTFLDKTGLEAQEVRELLYQKLYVDPSDHTIVEDGRENFYINTGLGVEDGDLFASGYVALSEDETTLEWVSLSDEDGGNTTVPLAWFDRASRFVRFAKKTGLAFDSLDHILRYCCLVDGVPELSESTLLSVAQVVYLTKQLDRPIATIVGILTSINVTGRTNDDLPQDQFNRIFNLPCVKVDKKFIHISAVLGDIPAQYQDTTYNDYDQITYYDDLFSDDNDDYRARLRHTLGFTETDLINITERLEYEGVATSSLWEESANEWALLNILYRIHALSNALDVHFLELFTLFEILEQDPFLGRLDPQTHFIYQVPGTQKCFQILVSETVNDQLWLLESLVSLTQWMKQYGYSAELLWKIVNAAPMTDKEESEQTTQMLAFYNALLAGFDTGTLTVEAFSDLGDERAAQFAYGLLNHRCGYAMADKPGADDWATTESLHKLVKHQRYELTDLAAEFLQRLDKVSHVEFSSLELGGRLEQKIFQNMVIHSIIDGEGVFIDQKTLSEGEVDPEDFALEFDLSAYQGPLIAFLHKTYLEALEETEADDEVEVQIFKSDLKDLGMSEPEAREAYNTLIFNGYIDEEGFVQEPDMFVEPDAVDELSLSVINAEMQHRLLQYVNFQLHRFQASRVQISAQMFAALELTSQALEDLIHNLQMNGYLDTNNNIEDKLRLLNESPDTMQLAARYYPQRKVIYGTLKSALQEDRDQYLRVNRDDLKTYCHRVAGGWAYEDLQGVYLDDHSLTLGARVFFLDDDNKASFSLRTYFDDTQLALIFDHLADLVNYLDGYRLTDKKLEELGFDEGERIGVRSRLADMGVIDHQEVFESHQLDYFSEVENAESFSVKGFEDFDREIFFSFHEVAKGLGDTVKNIELAVTEKAAAQEEAVLSVLEGFLGIEQQAIKTVSKAILKTENDIHVAWLEPLFRFSNTLNQLEKLPGDMAYTQAVKRIFQFAELIKKLQLDNSEIMLALDDQRLVDKFPEDLVLPNDADDPDNGDPLTAVDAILEADEFVYLFKDDYYWVYLSDDYTLIDKKVIAAGSSETDDDLLDLQKKDEARQKRLKDDPIRLLFDEEELTQVDAAFIDRYGTWCVVSGKYHYVKYADGESWDRRDNAFGLVDNDFDNLEMVDAAYVDEQGRLFIFGNDKYIRYSSPDFALASGGSGSSVDSGYPKSIAEDWNHENLPIQLPAGFERDLGPMFDGMDENSYAFRGDRFYSSEDGFVRFVADKWGHREHDFGTLERIDAAMASEGAFLLFHQDKVVKYAGSLELGNLKPESGYPKPLYEEFTDLPDDFIACIDAALDGLDGKTYLFHDDDCVTLEQVDGVSTVSKVETETLWGIVTNDIADSGTVDAAFVGLDGRTYLFSGGQYVRYSGTDYRQVDDGFPRDIIEDWEGLTRVTAAFILDDKTFLFGTNDAGENIYVRYSTLRKDDDDYLEVDEEDPNARRIETVLVNRPDVDDIKVFPAEVNAEFWSLPDSLTGGAEDFQIDAVMNGPDGKVYLFYGQYVIEHDHLSRWWSEPRILSDQWDRVPEGLTNVVAGFTGKDGRTYLFYESKFLRFSDAELYNLDNGYPRPTHKYWGRVRNNIEKTGRVDAALVVESRWEEQDKNGQLTDYVQDHTYLFSGDQFFRYKGDDYTAVEQGYPRSIGRLSEEPRFRGLDIDIPDGLDAAFADRRQVYLFKGEHFYTVIGDEDNYLQYQDSEFSNVAAVTYQDGNAYALSGADNRWYKFNHLDARTITRTAATPRVAEKAENALQSAISAVLHGIDGKSYVFAGEQCYDVSLELAFDITEVWGRSRNPIYDRESVDAAFVGRDGTTYVFSGEWFVQYDTETCVGQTTTYPPRRISSKWAGLERVVLAYVWKEETYLFGAPDASGHFAYLRYSKDSYERPDSGYPQIADRDFWQIPEAYLGEGFDRLDAIFVHEENLIFISDQKFISFDLNSQTWTYPRDLALIYSGIPFNKTNFKDLTSGFVGADGKAYFFSNETYVYYDPQDGWSDVGIIRDDWGLQANIFSTGVDAAFVSPTGVTYLFAGENYVRYSPSATVSNTYRFVDEEYPKKIATYLLGEDDFAFMPKEFQQHLDDLEAVGEDAPYVNGMVHNGRGLWVFTRDTVFTSAPDKFATYAVDGLGRVANNFVDGGEVDAAFVDIANEQTYLFSGEQYIRYTGDDYRYVDAGYPKIIAESLAAELGIDSLPEDYRNGIDAAFHLSSLGLVLFNEKSYLAIQDGNTNQGVTEAVWGNIDNSFSSDDTSIDGAFVDDDGSLYVFKGDQFVRYSDTWDLFQLNPYNEARYVDAEYPQDIAEQWPQLSSTILTDTGIDSVFGFEDQICFHTDGYFTRYAKDLSDYDEDKPVEVLAYRWGEWSDYLLSDIHLLSRFKDLGQKFTGGDLTLSEFATGSSGEVNEPYMQFAAIFGFEKEEVRWLKQRNGFLPEKVNAMEDEFGLELVLRLYDTLATTRRLRVDVSALYENVWSPLYAGSADYATAAQGAYDLLVQVDCDSNYEVLVEQIKDELNVIKRNALVPYVIFQDEDITTTRGLYQKLLIDIQMAPCARTSRIKEATAAIQLYLQRCLINLESVSLESSDQAAAREALKERWEWLQSYRVWEANRKVFLYPENYIRPELRDPDTKSDAFEALEESLSQGDLTETYIEEAYFKFLDTFTEVSELTIAGGYVYDDGDDKQVLVLGRTRTDPMRYFYRFGTFVGGSSAAATWDPWSQLDIPIEATRVEPVYAFNRVFIFWTKIEEVTSADSASSGTVSASGDDPQTVSSDNNSTYEVKIYYSFYNLNKRWTQPQSMQTEFNGSSQLQSSSSFSDIELFVENTTKLADYEEDYENIYVSVRSYVYTIGSVPIYAYAAYHLTPELYSAEATAQAVENSGQSLFDELFPEEGGIESQNVVMLNYSANSVDGPWFAYNHNGSGFLVKPDAVSASSSDTLDTIDSGSLPYYSEINAAVQLGTDKDVVFFLKDGTYVRRNTSGEVVESGSIGSRWGIVTPTEMQRTGNVDSAFVIGNSAYLTLDDEVYEYDYDDSDYATGIDSPARLVKTPYAVTALESSVPDSWEGISASFNYNNVTYLFEKNGTGLVERQWLSFNSTLYRGVATTTTLTNAFGYYNTSTIAPEAAEVIAPFNDVLHIIEDGVYTSYDANGTSQTTTDISVGNVLATMFGVDAVGNVDDSDYETVGIILTEGGVWIKGQSAKGSSTSNNFVAASGERTGSAPESTFQNWPEDDWVAGIVYSSGSVSYEVTFHPGKDGTNVNFKASNKDKFESTSTEINITGALEKSDGALVLVADNNSYYAVTAKSPNGVTSSLGKTATSLSNLDIGDYLALDTKALSLIGESATGIDAAFVGNGVIGNSDALYLFIADVYYRFTPVNGSFANTCDSGYPKTIATNSENLPPISRVDAAFSSPAVGGGLSYFFLNGDDEDSAPRYYYYDDDADAYVVNETAGVWGVEIVTNLQINETVDAAYIAEGVLYVFSDNEYYAYTLSDGEVPTYVDDDMPGLLPDSVVNVQEALLSALGDVTLSFDNIASQYSVISSTYNNIISGADDSTPITFDAAFVLNEYIYLFSGDCYYRLAVGDALSTLNTSSTITGNWGNLPATVRSSGLDAAFVYAVTEGNSVKKTLYLVQDGNFIAYDLSDDTIAVPYEIQDVNYEVIRLTSSTAEQLNQILFAKGIDGLLQMSTQEINESPTISFDPTSPDNIYMNEDRFASEPTNSHLDFHSANGLYYWEVFFHAPFLIAQTLNEDQKFEDAKYWFEYIFDPTQVADYWKFLPFLAADPDALMATLGDDLDNFAALTSESEVETARTWQQALAAQLAPYQSVFLGKVSKVTYEADLEESEGDDFQSLAEIESWDNYTKLAEAITGLDTSASSSSSNNALLATWQSEMQEVMAIIAQLDYRIDLMRNFTSQLSEYLDDPFDPHAIAALRPLAYRKAIVMRYVDNLLDWGDMLFRQYTRESINEARMLYVFAYDLLGEKPRDMGQVILSQTKSYSDFSNYSSTNDEDYNFLIDFENSDNPDYDPAEDYEQGLSFAATQFDSVTNPYFFLQENELFTQYWDRVEDRLDKIRHCLNIDGIAQPLPLFQPPIDPMALVGAAAGGGGAAAAAAAAGAVSVPDHRFTALLATARRLTDQVKSLGDNLLSTLEKKDSEALNQLQNQQESAVLELTTLLKQQQIEEAEQSLENLQASLTSAEDQQRHYENLISSGYLKEEEVQIGMMAAAAALNGITALGRIISGLSYVVPQITAGPFSFGVTTGGENIGGMLQQFAEATQSTSEALSMGGEVAGVVAQMKRTKQDWELQKKMATHEIEQLNLQITAQQTSIKMAQQELVVHQKSIENQKAITTFMKNKFSNLQLYSWMSGKLSGLFFQTYKMAHDYAKLAEQAFVFEKGVLAGDVNFINGMYWDSQKKGLLSGVLLESDLNRLENKHFDTDGRSLEITKNISLLELDPLALLQLKNKGFCNFRLSEELFDYDFPGHFKRQIKSISLAFDIGEGQLVNATLTQLNNKLVMAADIKAVKHLINPENEANNHVRVNWRANQQVALSHVDQYSENNGMFELNFNDERYLPFEGTGAVSSWRLELNGRKGSYNPADLLDVTIKLRYTAQQGGQRFATEVKGVLKPYHATSFFDLAYNFPDEWAALTRDQEDVSLTFTRDMFPNMSSSKIIGLYIHYGYQDGGSGAIFTLNDDFPVPNNTYLQPSTLEVGQQGAQWKFTLKGDRTTLKNAEMVLVYKAAL